MSARLSPVFRPSFYKNEPVLRIGYTANHIIYKIVQHVQNCAKYAKLCKMCKIVQFFCKMCKIVQNVTHVQNCVKYAKLFKTCKVVQNVKHRAKYANCANRHDQVQLLPTDRLPE